MTQPDFPFVGALFLVTELMVDNTPVSIMVSVPTQDQVLYTPVQAVSLYSLCNHLPFLPPFFSIKALVTGNNQLYFYIFTDSHMLRKIPRTKLKEIILSEIR